MTDGLVDYDAFRDAAAFRRYLASLARTSLAGADDEEQLAFWINVYNAYTIQLIVAHGERESIRNNDRTLGVLRLKGPWSEPIVRAAGRTLTESRCTGSVSGRRRASAACPVHRVVVSPHLNVRGSTAPPPQRENSDTPGAS